MKQRGHRPADLDQAGPYDHTHAKLVPQGAEPKEQLGPRDSRLRDVENLRLPPDRPPAGKLPMRAKRLKFETAIERLLILCPGSAITEADIPFGGPRTTARWQPDGSGSAAAPCTPSGPSTGSVDNAIVPTATDYRRRRG
jgi:hypothetical protein